MNDQPAKRMICPTELPGLIGQEIAISRWFTVDQRRIDTFAEATDDWQWIHVDVTRATQERGGTIAHGFLSLSLLSAMVAASWGITGAREELNYGFDKIRFLSPVPAGGKVRLRTSLLNVAEKAGGQLVTLEATVELEGSPRPACVAEWLVLFRT